MVTTMFESKFVFTFVSVNSVVDPSPIIVSLVTLSRTILKGPCE